MTSRFGTTIILSPESPLRKKSLKRWTTATSFFSRSPFDDQLSRAINGFSTSTSSCVVVMGRSCRAFPTPVPAGKTHSRWPESRSIMRRRPLRAVPLSGQGSGGSVWKGRPASAFASSAAGTWKPCPWTAGSRPIGTTCMADGRTTRSTEASRPWRAGRWPKGCFYTQGRRRRIGMPSRRGTTAGMY